jgi:hypothetical protein
MYTAKYSFEVLPMPGGSSAAYKESIVVEVALTW